MTKCWWWKDEYQERRDRIRAWHIYHLRHPNQVIAPTVMIENWIDSYLREENVDYVPYCLPPVRTLSDMITAIKYQEDAAKDRAAREEREKKLEERSKRINSILEECRKSANSLEKEFAKQRFEADERYKILKKAIAQSEWKYPIAIDPNDNFKFDFRYAQMLMIGMSPEKAVEKYRRKELVDKLQSLVQEEYLVFSCNTKNLFETEWSKIRNLKEAAIHELSLPIK